MASELVAFVDKIKSDKQIASYDETSLKQTVVMKLLFLLGWDIFDVNEVSPNHAVGKGQVDYALQIKKKSKVFVNVKTVGEVLDKYRNELFAPAEKENIEFAVLTNGVTWQFYLTTGKKNLEQKRVCTVNFASQPSDEIARKLRDFLSKDQVEKGDALKLGETLLKERHQKLIEETLPRAWRQILSKPPDMLVDLLSETAEKICGFSPERKTAAKFLSGGMAEAAVERHPPPQEKPQSVPRGYEDQSISSFSLKKKSYSVKAWGVLVVKLCEVLKFEYGQDIEKLLWHSVGDKYYFSRDASELRFPESIEGTDIYAQTIRNPNEAVNAARSILSFFGYAKDDFSITAK